MASTMKPLSTGKSYHFHVIYNHAQMSHLATDDQKLSLKFVEFLVEKLYSGGYTECYYHEEHSLPGRNVFNELFRVLDESEWTVIVVTKEFSDNCWVKYCSNATFKKLIDERKDDSLIPIALGVDSVPQEFGAKHCLSFEADPNTWSEGKLEKIIKVLDAGLPVSIAESDTSKQDPGDGRLRSEGNQLIANPQPSLPYTSDGTQQVSELILLVGALCLSKTQPIPSADVDYQKNPFQRKNEGDAGDEKSA